MSLTKPGNEQSRPGKSRIGAAVIAMTLAVSHILIVQTPASAAHEIGVPTGTLTDFSVLAHSLITDTGGTSTFADGVGVWPGDDVVGISDDDVDSGGIHLGDEVAEQAQTDFSMAYDYAAAQIATPIAAELGGQTLKAGVYSAGGTALSLGTTLTLDADGDKNAIFIIQTEGAFGSTATTGQVVLIDGAQDCNVFFQVAGAVTLGASSTFRGTVLSQGAITVGAGASFSGRAFTGSGDMTLSGNRFDEPSCDGTTVTPTHGLVTTEAGTVDTFTVVLDSQPSADVTIGVSSSDTTEGTVDTALLTFTTVNWATPQTVTVTGVDDSIDDGDIGYTVVLAPAAGGGFTGVDSADVEVTNSDDDTVGVTVTPVVGLITTEAGTVDTFTVVLDSQPSADVTIGVSSSDTTEGTVDTALLTFTTVNWATAQTVTVTGVNDSVEDGDVAYSVVLAVATGGDYAGIDPDDLSVTNVDNDPVGVTVTPTTTPLVTSESGGIATFTVVLDSQPSADVTIGVSSSDTTEGTVDTAFLTFTTVNWATAQTVTVTGVNDSVEDGDVAYSVVLEVATGGDYAGIDPDDVAVSTTDDDTVGVTVTPVVGLITTEAGTVDTFTVVLDSQPSADVTIGVSSSDTTEGTVDTALLTFTTVNWATPQTVTVTGVDDSIDDGDIGYTVVLAPAAGGGFTGVDSADVEVTNSDDDTVGVTVTPTTTPLVTSESGGIATFTVVLDSQPSADVTIGVSSSDTTEGTVDTAFLTFTTVNWATAQTVTVTGVNDSVEDGDVAYSVVLEVATGGDYAGIDPDDVAVVNTTGPAPRGVCSHDFSDVDDSNIFEGDICWLADQGITRGCNPPSNTEFCPNDPVTRGQMAAFLVRAFGYTDDGGGDLFTDDDGSTFEADIDRLGTAGVTRGCNPPANTEFCPDDPVTRGQMAAFLVRAFGFTDNGGGDLFTDDNSSTFEADIDQLGTAGVTRGCNPPSNTEFCPNDNVTREQMAAFLKRAFQG